MLTLDEARTIAIHEIGPDCALYEVEILEKPYGWYFQFQSKKYIVSGNFRDMLIGSGGFIVEKEDGHIVQFGSGMRLEDWFTLYEAGFMFEWYDLTIHQVRDAAKTTEFLMALRLTYFIPEIENDVTWRIPKPYTVKQIRTKLSALPCTFSPVWFQGSMRVWEAFRSADASGCCIYERSGHYGQIPDLAGV